jgi:hypothetical protein
MGSCGDRARLGRGLGEFRGHATTFHSGRRQACDGMDATAAQPQTPGAGASGRHSAFVPNADILRPSCRTSWYRDREAA